MKKKMGISLALILAAVLCLTGCRKPDGDINEFCDAMQFYDIDAMNDYFMAPDNWSNDEASLQKAATDEAFSALADYFKDSTANHMSYEITDSTVDADYAEVTVRFKYRDCSQIIANTTSESIPQLTQMYQTGSSPEDCYKAYGQLLLDAFKNQDVPMTTVDITLPCNYNSDQELWQIDNSEEITNQLMDVMTCNAFTSFVLSGTTLATDDGSSE